MMVARPVTPDSGKPPPSPLATVMRSGTTPECSMENILPVRAMPPCTSSAIITMPCSSHRRRSARRKSAGATLKPPSPCTGSMMTAATDFGSTSPLNSGARSASARPVGMRKFGVIHLGRERSEAALVGHDLAGERHGHERAAVKTAREGDYRAALGVVAGNLDGILDSFRAGVQEQGFLREVAGRQRVQPLRQPHIGFVGRHMEAGMSKCLRLLRHRLHDPRMAMACVDHGNTRCEIDVAPAVHIPQ